MIVVSNRGPFRFARNADGTFSTHRGAGGVVSALMPLLANREDATWVAAAISADDRAAVEAGHADPDRRRARQAARARPDVSRLHYDVISNGVLWFLHHGLFDLARRPRFDRHFREAWEGYVSVNRSFTDAVIDVARTGRDGARAGLPAHARPADARRGTPGPARGPLHAHTVLRPELDPGAARVRRPRDLLVDGRRAPPGFHTERWARAFRASVHEVLGSDAAVGRTFAASFGPDPAVLAAEIATPEVDAEIAALEERVGDRQLIVRSDRMELSKNIVRGFLAYDLLLEEHPELRERVTFAALLNPSRDSLPEYHAYRNEVEHAARARERALGDARDGSR